METRMNRHLALQMLAGLAACGGGGGSASSDPAPDPDAPTFAFNAAYRSPDELSQQIMATGAFMLQLAQFTTDMAQRFAVPGSARSVSANCAYTGSVDLLFDDRDNSGGPTAGDSIAVTLRDCGVPILARTATGTLRVDIRAVGTAGVEAELQSQMTVLDALQLERFGPTNAGDVPPLGTLRGSLEARWSSDGLTEQLRALSTTADDLRLNALHGGAESVDGMRRIDVGHTARLDTASVESSMSYVLDVGSRGGHLRVRQAVPFASDLNALPRSGRVEADLAGNELLQIQKVVRGSFHMLEWVWSRRPSGYVLFRNDQTWDGAYGMLTYDVRLSSGAGLPLSAIGTTDVGGGYGVAAPWLGVMAYSAIDRACAQIGVAGVSAYTRADALFQRPVVPVPGATSEGSVYRLQFGRALASNTPAMQFRFRDAQETPEPDYPYWNVAATAGRRGAVYDIRPAEALRHGRTYYLESSLDGIEWNGERNFYDTGGQLMSIGGSTLATVYTDDVLLVELARPVDLVVLSATKPARLVPVVTARDGQAIASYRWEQLSGAPVNFSAPESAVTDVGYAAGPRDVAPVLIQLTVTDVHGARQRLRTVLTVGDRISIGGLFYRRQSDSAPTAS